MNKNTFENHTNSNSNSKRKTNTNDCHWTLSTPVRRASSLKYLNHSLTSPPPTMPYQRLSIGSRPATSASNYPSNDDQYLRQHHHRYSNRNYRYNNPEEDYYNIGDNDDDDDDDEGVDDPQLDLISQRSWKSSSALNATTKRRTLSMLSVFSGNSSRCGSVVSNRSRSQQPDSNVLTQFEKQLLHKDLKRNSFRAVSATTKDFVMNPLFEKQQQEFFNGEGGLKLSIAKPKRSQEEDYDDRRRDEEFTRQQGDDQGGDSGVDSCLNGFSEKARDEGKLKIVDDGFIF
uniref:Uncharacterized protein n=1 Tax=Musca domestica TaxID=7370 RepID=T1PIE0_MUSDO